MFWSVISINCATVINNPKISVVCCLLVADSSSGTCQTVLHAVVTWDPSSGGSHTGGHAFFLCALASKSQLVEVYTDSWCFGCELGPGVCTCVPLAETRQGNVLPFRDAREVMQEWTDMDNPLTETGWWVAGNKSMPTVELIYRQLIKKFKSVYSFFALI